MIYLDHMSVNFQIINSSLNEFNKWKTMFLASFEKSGYLERLGPQSESL
jgi:hypothetical protein